MDKQFNGWIIAGIVGVFLFLFVVFSVFSYISDLKIQQEKSLQSQQSNASATPFPSPTSNSTTLPSNVSIMTNSRMMNSSSTLSPIPANNSATSIPSFSGYVGDIKGKKKFLDFLSGNERKVIKIDITVSLEQEEGITEPEFEGSPTVDLTYKDEFITGGELIIDSSNGEKDLSFSQRRLQSYLKIIRFETHQGLVAIISVPVSIESIR